MQSILLLLSILATVSAFMTPVGKTGASRMTMLFNFGKKQETSTYKINEGTANKGTYIPEGLTKEQYEKFLQKENEMKASKAKKFPKGKTTESLTEWMEKEAKKGNTGKDLLLKGHRMVKAKYDEFYTDESPV